MPSNMVTGGGQEPTAARNNSTYRNTLLTNKPLLAQDRFHIRGWAPRTGYGKSYEAWLEDLTRLLKALGISIEDLHSPVQVGGPIGRYACLS